LAGLHEFPTSANVPVTTSGAAMTETAHSLLSDLLTDPPPPFTKTIRKQSSLPGTRDRLTIVRVQTAGDVLHVFSHIRKTYRVQWVVLEGGGSDPPPLAQSTASSNPPKAKREVAGNKTKTGKKKSGKSMAKDDQESGSSTPIMVMWTSLEDVPNYNIGTGVLKVWNQVSKLWDDR